MLGLMTLAPASDALAAGWSKSGDSWVYYDNNGSLYKGWIRTTDGYYYLDLTSGKMTLGWKQINNKWYYSGPTASWYPTAGSALTESSITFWMTGHGDRMAEDRE